MQTQKASANKLKVFHKQVLLYDGTIRNGTLDVIKKWIEKGADINSRDKHGKTLLWWSVFNGNIELTRYLLNNGADLKLADYQQKKTPLEVAHEFALRGYKEPNEPNPHAAIIKLLNVASTPLLAQENKRTEDDEIHGLTSGLSKLGFAESEYNKSLSAEANITTTKQADKATSITTSESSCIIL